MKRLLATIPFLFALCTTAIAQLSVNVDQTELLPYRDTSKRIKSMRSSYYHATMLNGKAVLGAKMEEAVFFYDKQGRLYKRQIIYPVKDGKYTSESQALRMQHAFNDSVTFADKLVYDERGNLLAMPHDPVAFAMSGTFTYNDKNQRTELKQYSHYTGEPEKLDVSQTYQYNTDGKISERATLKPNGKLDERTVFEYDKAGRLIDISTADATHVTNHTKLIYDNRNGKLMHLVVINEDNEFPVQYDYEYDNHDRKLRIYKIYNTSKALYSEYKYNTTDEGYQYTENPGYRTVVQNIGPGYRKRQIFENGRALALLEWHYDKHGNATWHLDATYPLPPAKTEPVNITVQVNDIKYRGGIFTRVGMWFRKMPLGGR